MNPLTLAVRCKTVPATSRLASGAPELYDLYAASAKDCETNGKPMRIAMFDVLFFKESNSDPQRQLASAVEGMNERIQRDSLDVVNVESVYEQELIGTRQIGLRIWYRTT